MLISFRGNDKTDKGKVEKVIRLELCKYIDCSVWDMRRKDFNIDGIRYKDQRFLRNFLITDVLANSKPILN